MGRVILAIGSPIAGISTEDTPQVEHVRHMRHIQAPTASIAEGWCVGMFTYHNSGDNWPFFGQFPYFDRLHGEDSSRLSKEIIIDDQYVIIIGR